MRIQLEIKAHKTLFDDWSVISAEIDEIAGLVKKDRDITEEELNQWSDRVTELIKLIDFTRSRTIGYVIKLNKWKGGLDIGRSGY